MPHKTLQQLLHRLHEELQTIDSLDETNREKLAQVQGDIQNLLARDDMYDAESDSQDLGDQLNEVIADLDESHPTIVTAIREIINALSNIGI